MSYQAVLPLLDSDQYSYVPKHMDCLHKHLYQFHSHHLKIEIKKTVSVHVYYTLFILKDEFVKGYGYIMHLNLTSDIFFLKNLVIGLSNPRAKKIIINK